MKTSKLPRGWLLAALFFLFAAGTVLAQPAAAPAAPAVAPAPAMTLPATPNNPFVQLLTPLVAILVTFAVKKMGNLQGWVVPVISAVVGLAYDAATAYATGHTLSPLTGLLLGLAATGLHQIGSQLNQKPDSAPPPAAGG